ncbi:hypothetical protein SAMN03080617_03357 [Algoriphagus alkaliphilus]|uniref:Uncharacterized protein n=1 Tax=Algoriphagus alkaliphilus TaxID=279824 RepID=A0A1G5Z942_9BACT|nr:hypothetical protein SAMN03080617_03357 [Algoriphagus alkaliphilus]
MNVGYEKIGAVRWNTAPQPKTCKGKAANPSTSLRGRAWNLDFAVSKLGLPEAGTHDG